MPGPVRSGPGLCLGLTSSISHRLPLPLLLFAAAQPQSLSQSQLTRCWRYVSATHASHIQIAKWLLSFCPCRARGEQRRRKSIDCVVQFATHEVQWAKID